MILIYLSIGLYRIPVYSRFGWYTILVYSRFGWYRIPVYSRVDFYRIPVYSRFGLYRILVYLMFGLYGIPVYSGSGLDKFHCTSAMLRCKAEQLTEGGMIRTVMNCMCQIDFFVVFTCSLEFLSDETHKICVKNCRITSQKDDKIIFLLFFYFRRIIKSIILW